MKKVAVLAASVCTIALLAGCTVKPLYGTGNPVTVGASSGSIPAELASIGVPPVNTRPAQQVRNHLIFLLYGGAGQPAAPAYELQLIVKSALGGGIPVKVGGSPLAGRTLRLAGAYNLVDAKTDKLIVSGRRTIRATFGSTSQEFANVRAQRDAENRAAKELAEMLRLDLVTKLDQAATSGRRFTEEDLEQQLDTGPIDEELPTIDDVN